MKKIIGVLIVAATLVSSTFALGLSFGGRGLAGGRLDTVQKIKTNKGEGLSFGGGAYVNVEAFAGLGAQAEANFVVNKLPNGKNLTLVDIPLMLWYRLDLFDVLQVGFGAGPNFTNVFTNFKDLVGDVPDIASKEPSKWNTGIAVGTNFKIFFNKHIGLVLGANAVFDLDKSEMFKTLAAAEKVSDVFGGSDGKRKEIYGTLGLEFRLF